MTAKSTTRDDSADVPELRLVPDAIALGVSATDPEGFSAAAEPVPAARRGFSERSAREPVSGGGAAKGKDPARQAA